MKKNWTKILFGVLIAALVVVCVIWFMDDEMEHIEDTNGPDDYTLTTITDADIIENTMYVIGLKESTDILTNTITYSSDKFTGVYDLGYMDTIFGTALNITVNHAQVTEGNFRIVVLMDNEIVHEFKLNELSQTYTIENPKGVVSLRIAGESASFKLDYSFD